MKQPVDSTLPRVAFDFIVKSNMDFFVWYVDRTMGFILVGRGGGEE
jgi:hypothetical protein